ncbi:MAG: hypothetical protein ABIN48_15860 [Ginsengibacter sp.]
MHKFYIGIPMLFLLVLTGCSKKASPSKSNTSVIDYKKESVILKNESDEKEVIEERKTNKSKTVYPNIITVHEAAAKKAVDGRMYYDINGRRYWKNFKDGKYYLFDKSMYNNPDFKPKKDDSLER